MENELKGFSLGRLDFLEGFGIVVLDLNCSTRPRCWVALRCVGMHDGIIVLRLQHCSRMSRGFKIPCVHVMYVHVKITGAKPVSELVKLGRWAG